MSSSMNGRVYDNHFTAFRRPRSVLTSIHENQRQRCGCSVPDVNLECDEVINWDDLDSSNASLYSADNNEKLPVVGYNSDATGPDCSDLGYSFPPPNSPENGTFDAGMQNRYVMSLLQLWRDAGEYAGSSISSQDSTQATMSDESQCVLSDDHCSTTYMNNIDDYEIFSLPKTVDPSEQVQTEKGCTGSISDETCMPESSTSLNFMPTSQSSSRSTSPIEIEAISHSVLHLSFDNLRSISPRLVRSPSPITSRSSSPRFLRSPSPLQILNNSFQGVQMDESVDALLFYDDQYIFRSTSPNSPVTDHMVPDVDMDFEQEVSFFGELPSFTSYNNRRQLNSCEDQVVPEYVEE